MKDKKFNWGVLEGFTKENLNDEFFNPDDTKYNPYQQIYSVKEGDIVLDLGASVGPFTWNIQDKAEKVICVEPSVALLPALRSNVNDNVSIIEAAFGNYYQKRVEIDGIFDQEGSQKAFDKVNVIDFETICKSHFLDRIDFIKTDCEGGEYSLFTDKNMPFLLNNVRNIVGEFHLRTPLLKTEFRYFRDKYLVQFPNYVVNSVDHRNQNWDLFNDHFLEYYSEVIVNISNE